MHQSEVFVYHPVAVFGMAPKQNLTGTSTLWCQLQIFNITQIDTHGFDFKAILDSKIFLKHFTVENPCSFYQSGGLTVNRLTRKPRIQREKIYKLRDTNSEFWEKKGRNCENINSELWEKVRMRNINRIQRKNTTN